MNCFVNGQSQQGPEINGTNGDDSISCDVLAPGDAILEGGGKDTINVTENDFGIVSGGGGGDNIFVVTHTGGLIQGGAGNDHIDVRDNAAASEGTQSRVRDGDGDDTITVMQNHGLVEGDDGFDTCSVTMGNPALCEAS
ncbi:hypothetical protein GCM10010324_67680 [Streptomyces hiroshimensis]|uniref:Calcium-binding protein n=2 Tax=Streptomyces hiroshimensis TaxID=66424 RepID=A0ABQ2ZFS6_9ACTN|nr:hypothetical protein GCM10010324_67680 [Streptomyces hiroshimensis]